MKKLFFLLVFCINFAFCVDVSQVIGAGESELNTSTWQDINSIQVQNKRVFGDHLFGGNFKDVTKHAYNPDYKIDIGDQIALKIWGAVEFEKILIVDSQGNIFIPQVGAVRVLGVRNADLLDIIKARVAQIYKNNVFVYADMNAYQNVSVFVTGNVNAPGLYQGLSSDSIIQFLDKAGGINLDYGSFRDIQILRNNELIAQVDLYEFLLQGKLGLFAFRNADVILVGDVKNYAFVSGDVQRPFRFELKDDIKTLADLALVAGARPIVTHAAVKTYGDNHALHINAYTKDDFTQTALNTGDEVEFRPDYTTENISVRIEGEHNSRHLLVLQKGTTLEELVKLIQPNAQSDMNSVQVFRKSVANTQKSLIEAQLKELETIALTASSVNSESAAIRASQSKTILEFIQRAKQVEPKGQVVIEDSSAYKSLVLEDGDLINIPNKNNLVIVQGEVALPGAFVFMGSKKLSYYVKLAGDFSSRADKSRVLVIHSNGKAQKYSVGFWGSATVKPGDSVLVLPKVDTQGLQITSMITQILYQIAIATNVVLNINN